jgi:xylanolytic transcriptional activator XlnR
MSETAASAWAQQQAMYGSSQQQQQQQQQQSDLSIMEMNVTDPMSDVDRARTQPNRSFSSSSIHRRAVPDYSMQPFYPNTHPSSAATGNRLDMMHLVEQRDATRPSRALAGDVAFMEPSPGSPAWLNLPSPPFAEQTTSAPARSTDTLRYPVLRPLLPLIESIIPRSSACDLLDVYFASSSYAQLRPLSPHILGYIFRKKSFLHPTRPRVSSPALLASMLWIAAQTSNASFLNAHPAARGRVCRQLLELTVDLLKPLIHSPVPGGTSLHGPTNHIIDDVSLGVLGVSTDHAGFEGSVTAHVDVLATYIHLATVVSASERKAASLRWWGAAWSIARELKFGREAPPSPPQHELGDFIGESSVPKRDFENDTRDPNQAPVHQSMGFLTDTSRRPGFMTEEEREERRRVWWLLYMMDRHLALCYNRPLALLDKECEGLLQPMDDTAWQSGQFPASDTTFLPYRRRGPSVECTGLSIFGYFLPLMTILGNIVHLNQSRSRPTFGTGFHNPGKWDDDIQEITHQLELYGQSLHELELHTSLGGGELGLDNRLNEATTPSVRSASTTDSQMANELVAQRKTTVAYGTYIMHVLHILLAGKWDPITLLDDNDLWISTQGFLTATDHAIAAAGAVSGILEFDPDLSFMPFFLGVYLLQGSFLLLLFADKLQGDVSPDVVKACETVIRAHEACVVTLDTQYQVCTLVLEPPTRG